MLDFNALPEWLIQAGEEEEEEDAVVKTGGSCWRRQVTAPQGRRRLSNQPSVFDFELQMSGIVVNESKSDGGAGTEMAHISANNFRQLRKRGITVRKTADVIIASFCIQKNIPLLFTDKDFQPFVKHMGLIDASI